MRLTVTCPNCHKNTEVDSFDRDCHHCGERVPAERISNTEPAEGRR